MSLMQWFRALRRGEKKVSKTVDRGRVYKRKKEEPDSGGSVIAKSEPIGQISARVYRKDSDTWEDLGVVSRGPVVDSEIQPERK